MNLRKITSLTMLISFVLLVVTSIILYIVPQGRVAYWADWKLWGLTKSQWGDLHINLGFLFLLAGFLHIVYNWKAIVAYLKDKSRQLKIFTANFNVALLLTLVVALGTYFQVPPMSTVINISDAIKDAAAEKYGEPPYGHAELSSLKLFARQTNLDLNQAMDLLTQAGIKFDGEQDKLIDIAKKNNVSPKKLYEIMLPAKKETETTHGLPDAPPAGFGRQALAEVCTRYGLNMPTVLRELKKQGISADPAKTIKEIAADNDMDPHALFEVLHGVATEK
ncbi:hypothetical protein GF1_06910 [Desulfolithobacter dissulfuricans]|uniref:Flavinylation-associated cytochrome domain-containing protein n=1 Tax=Desulfolithobacter dissulfuricans TaxID=2795293 RepID=A0A915U9F0_9BACT|nr:DUF4405 domain-containing protein [Desulfolithobacter dissulfuricans]BCO08315.1 hypothetical protein GF1_06910 [Desulfolithobacter dissulfuricans]